MSVEQVTFKEAHPDYEGLQPDGQLFVRVRGMDKVLQFNFDVIDSFAWLPDTDNVQIFRINYLAAAFQDIPACNIVLMEWHPNSPGVQASLEIYQNELARKEAARDDDRSTDL